MSIFFDLPCSNSQMPNIADMPDDQLAAEIQKGLDDFQAGRSQPADKVFEEIEKKLGL